MAGFSVQRNTSDGKHGLYLLGEAALETVEDKVAHEPGDDGNDDEAGYAEGLWQPAGDHKVAVGGYELGHGVKGIVGHEVCRDYGRGVDDGGTEEQDVYQHLPYLVEVAEVDVQCGEEQTDAVDEQ